MQGLGKGRSGQELHLFSQMDLKILLTASMLEEFRRYIPRADTRTTVSSRSATVLSKRTVQESHSFEEESRRDSGPSMVSRKVFRAVLYSWRMRVIEAKYGLPRMAWIGSSGRQRAGEAVERGTSMGS